MSRNLLSNVGRSVRAKLTMTGRTLVIGAVLAAPAATLGEHASSAQALSASANGELRLAADASCLDVPNGNNAWGIHIHQTACDAQTYQRWTLDQVDSEWFQIRNVATGACAEVFNSSMAAGEELGQWGCFQTANQLFRWYNGSSLQVKHSGMVLDKPMDGSGRITQYVWHGGSNQEFMYGAGGSRPTANSGFNSCNVSSGSALPKTWAMVPAEFRSALSNGGWCVAFGPVKDFLFQSPCLADAIAADPDNATEHMGITASCNLTIVVSNQRGLTTAYDSGVVRSYSVMIHEVGHAMQAINGYQMYDRSDPEVDADLFACAHGAKAAYYLPGNRCP